MGDLLRIRECPGAARTAAAAPLRALRMRLLASKAFDTVVKATDANAPAVRIRGSSGFAILAVLGMLAGELSGRMYLRPLADAGRRRMAPTPQRARLRR
jgi:hypothetical protein